MQAIGHGGVWEKIQTGSRMALVEVLDPEHFRTFHLPGAINVPLDENFERRIQDAVSDKTEPVVVYSLDRNCPASSEAARRLDALGYREVYDYAEGKLDWKEAGLRIESPTAVDAGEPRPG